MTDQRLAAYIAAANEAANGSALTPNRKRENVYARRLVAWALRKGHNLPFREVGEILGGKDHASIVHAINGLADALWVQRDIRSQFNRFVYLIEESGFEVEAMKWWANKAHGGMFPNARRPVEESGCGTIYVPTWSEIGEIPQVKLKMAVA